MAKVLELGDQVALVTGSARGLGWSTAKAFADQGARVVINYFATSEAEVSQQIEKHFPGAIGSRILAYQADVTDPVQVQQMFAAAVEAFGKPVSTVVNNAMAGKFKFDGDARPKLEDLQWSQMETQLRGFLQGTLNTTKAAIPGFEKSGYGRIINIGTNLLSNPVVPYHDYVAAKGSLMAFTRTCAAELGNRNINVNMVSGGLLRITEASESTPDEVFSLIEGVTPLKRVITPGEVADVVLFLASPWSRAVTGQDLHVDGGLVMK